MMKTLLTMGLSSFGAMIALMSAVWWISMRVKNAGFVDVAWAFGFSIVASIGLIMGGGYVPRRALLFVMVFGWSLRLGKHLYRRVMGHHPVEDGRYAELREKWRDHLNLKFFAFFQFQALLVVALSVPFMIVSMNPHPALSLLEMSGAILWAAALLGESQADAQLRRFKADPADRGGVCQTGLWRYSRHPNYFFEWLVWIAFALFALGSPHGWVGIANVAVMFYFLYFVTGIPATEAHAVRTKGEKYLEYQRRTSAFIPWFVRN